ncbi:MAG: sugar phosphate nucleotidyltransferase [Myxococcota bacterium]
MSRFGRSGSKPLTPLWALVLAGGNGARLSELTTARYGYPRPKQFCALLGEQTLLEQTIVRAQLAVPSNQIMVSSRRSFRDELPDALRQGSPIHLSEQPGNAGTTPAVLLALTEIYARAPDARVVILPSDHFVSDDAAFMDTVRAAALPSAPSVVLLGAQLASPDDGLGWIEPQTPGAWVSPIARFVEKPDRAARSVLHANGALANTFTIVGRAHALIALIGRYVPRWFEAIWQAQGNPASLDQAYETLPASDLSRDVLQHCANELSVMPLQGVQWSDVGTPDRLARALRQQNDGPTTDRQVPDHPLPL